MSEVSPVHRLFETFYQTTLNHELTRALTCEETVDSLCAEFPGVPREQVLSLLMDQTMAVTTNIDFRSSTSSRGSGICMARTGKNKQCTRPIKKNGDGRHCSSHLLSRPYNDIDEVFHQRVPKKRGRKKVSKTIPLEEVDRRVYLKAKEVKVADKPYLIDANRLLFDPDNLQIVGIVNEETEVIEWF